LMATRMETTHAWATTTLRLGPAGERAANMHS